MINIKYNPQVFNPYLIFMQSEMWLSWINTQEIDQSQLAVREDKYTKLCDIEVKATRICYVQPKNVRFNKEIKRYYVPKNTEQILEFFKSVKVSVIIELKDGKYRVSQNEVYFDGDDLYELLSRVVQKLLKGGRIK